MSSISSTVKRIVDEKPLLQEGLRQGIISHASLAESLKPMIRQQMGGEVTDSAIIMALRRHQETLEAKEIKEIRIDGHTQLTLKTGLVYFSVKKSQRLYKKIETILKVANSDEDLLNLIHGNHEVSIITNDMNEKKVADALEAENVTTKERNLVSISMGQPKDFLYTPGILFAVTRKLYWDNINIFEIVTTATELNFIFQKKDAMRAYASIQELIEGKD